MSKYIKIRFIFEGMPGDSGWMPFDEPCDNEFCLYNEDKICIGGLAFEEDVICRSEKLKYNKRRKKK